ncbi:MAG: hypothetical protein EOO52_13430 [Gammaproteobacteria bacterium]|nr:MAG: hypothetical protein EOO52_13430 [Gammaproteobacteria bacterium]
MTYSLPKSQHLLAVIGFAVIGTVFLTLIFVSYWMGLFAEHLIGFPFFEQLGITGISKPYSTILTGFAAVVSATIYIFIFVMVCIASWKALKRFYKLSLFVGVTVLRCRRD